MAETVAEIRARARRDADATLDVHWHDLPLPVNPTQIATDLGIQVFYADIEDDTFGILSSSPTGVDMYIDRRQAPVRARFTCAHEIGHYVDRMSAIQPEADTTVSFIDRRKDDGKGDAAEIYANEFAGSLLMPENSLREMARDRVSDIEAADRFGVSLQALRYRKQLLKIGQH